MAPSKENLIWIDLEMTGLDPERDQIIEIATIITDEALTILAEGPVIAIHQSTDMLAGMDEWNTRVHGRSGLTERVRKSRISTGDAELETLDFIKQHVPAQSSPMCGNTICQDRRFLYRYMPELVEYFHYRNLDVSTIKELIARWYPKELGFIKQSTHQAQEDICDSIAELRYYRDKFFITL